MKVFLIGGTGFIGRQVTGKLITLGHSVGIFHRGKTAAAPSDPAVHFYGARSDEVTLTKSIGAFSPDVVVDLISYTEEDARSLLQACRGRTQRIVCVSSMDVYAAYGEFRRLERGGGTRAPFDETAPLRTALYPYRSLAATATDLMFNYEKILVERTLLEQADTPSTILRLGKVFGPHDQQHTCATYLRPMEKGEAIRITAPKARWRWTRCYVEDAAFAISLAVDQKAAGRIYNVGEAKAQREIDWIRNIGAACGWQGKIKVVPLTNPADDEYDWSYALEADTSLIRTELGYRETASTREAFRRTISWERSQYPM